MPNQDHSSTTEPIIDKRSADIAIVCTQQAEIRPLLQKLDRVRKYVDQGAMFRGGFLDETLRIAVVEAGPGFARHRQLTKTLIDEHHPVWVLSVGFSSALVPDLRQGDCSLASQICDQHGNSLEVKCPIPESSRVRVQRHLVADQHPATHAQRVALAESSEAAAVDTTSLAVAQVCRGDDPEKWATRFLSVRGIVGAFEQDLSAKAVAQTFNPETQKKPSLIGKLKARVKPDPEAVQWQALMDETAINMNRFLMGVVRQLGEKLGKSRWP